jgi:nitrile hydratase accessory protein
MLVGIVLSGSGRCQHTPAPGSSVKLSEQGHFTWKEWTAALAEELKAAADRGEPDDGTRYYHHWLTALERSVTAKRLSDPNELSARKEGWADAYRHTPHGKPVELHLRTRQGNGAEYDRVFMKSRIAASDGNMNHGHCRPVEGFP